MPQMAGSQASERVAALQSSNILCLQCWQGLYHQTPFLMLKAPLEVVIVKAICNCGQEPREEVFSGKLDKGWGERNDLRCESTEALLYSDMNGPESGLVDDSRQYLVGQASRVVV